LPLLRIDFKKRYLRTGIGFPRIKVVFSLDSAIAPDMKYRDPAVSQYSPDEEVTVAFRRVFFAAEEHNAVVLRTFNHPLNSGLKQLAASQLSVEDMVLLVIEFVAIWSPAKLLAERDVSDPTPQQSLLERSCVEVWDIAGPWQSTYIGNDFDVVTLEETQEIFESDVGVSDGVETWLCTRHSQPACGHIYRHHP